MLLHPLTTPWSRLEPRPNTEIAVAHCGQCLAQRVARNDRRNFGILRIDIEVNLWEQDCLVYIEHYPIHEVEALIHLCRVLHFCFAEITDASSTGAILYLIFWKINVNEISIVCG